MADRIPALASSTRAVLGGLLLLTAEASVLLGPPGWLTVALAAAATLAMARVPRLDWVSAGLLVAVAIPFGRGADLYPVSLAGIPVHPHDAVIAVAAAGAITSAWRSGGAALRERLERGRVLIVATALFALVGLLAVGLGISEGHDARDLLRDARWWFLYLAAPLAALAGTRRDAVIRALVAGAACFSLTLLAALLLPAIGQGLKAAAVTADLGQIRLQYGNSIFLLPAIALVTWDLLRRPRAVSSALLAVLAFAQVVSLTRTTIAVTLLVLVAIVIVSLATSSRQPRSRSRRTAMVLGMVLALGLTGLGSLALVDAVTLAEATPGTTPVHAVDRLLFQDETSDFAAIAGSAASGGRLATYLNAYALIRPSPLLGAGMGQQVAVHFATHPGRVFEEGQQPGVDDAYLTVGMKAGALGITAFAGLLILPLLSLRRLTAAGRFPLRAWYLPAWLGILLLTLTQSFAVSGYGPWGIAILAAIPYLVPGVSEEHVT